MPQAGRAVFFGEEREEQDVGRGSEEAFGLEVKISFLRKDIFMKRRAQRRRRRGKRKKTLFDNTKP